MMSILHESSPIKSDGIAILRGIAALSVLLFHSVGHVAHDPLWPPMEWIRSVCLQGWLGVHVFFVISGYCMHSKMDKLAAAHHGGGAFLADRFWRIMPTYWAALGFSLFLSVLSAPFNSLGWSQTLSFHWKSVLANLTLLHPFSQTDPLLLVSWTLTVEWGFYLLCFLLLSAQKFGFSSRSMVAMALIPAAMVFFPGIPFGHVVLTYWPAFCLGFAVYEIRQGASPRLGVLGFGALALLGWLRPGTLPALQWHTELGTSILLLWLTGRPGALPDWRVLRLLSRIGLFSYSIYLVHVPVLSRLGNLSFRFLSPESPLLALYWFGSIILTLFISWVFYVFFEHTFEKIRKPTPVQNV
jgi:peptidoglycan/LPS O-acetylase OafA/YrhL